MAITNGYCTLVQVKNILGITGTSHDTELEAAIESASRVIDDWTSQRFWADGSDTTRYFTPDDGRTLDLLTCGDRESSVVQSITTLTVDVDRDNSFSETWTEGTDFFLAPRSNAAASKPYTAVEIYGAAGRRWPVGQRDGVKIVGTFGWASAPKKIEQACIQLAERVFKETREAPFGVSVFGDGLDGGVIRTGGQLARQVAGLLEEYRRLAVY